LTAIRDALLGFLELVGLNPDPSGREIIMVTDSANAIGWLDQHWATNVPEIHFLVRTILDLIDRNILFSQNDTLTWKKVKAHQSPVGADLYTRLNIRADEMVTSMSGGTAQ
jgi:hypothetical protein